MLRVEVKADSVQVREGDSKRTGRPYSFREQSAWVDLGRAYPVEVRFVLADKQAPFPPGQYDAGSDCWAVDRNFNLTVDFRKMRVVQKPQAVPAAAR